MGENTNERLERLENAMTKLLDGVDEPEDDDKEVEGYV